MRTLCDVLGHVPPATSTRRRLLGSVALGAGTVGAIALAYPEAASPLQLTGFYDVQADFGARGDGQHDDTEAITGALVAAGHSGGTIFFAPGTYVVTDQLSLPDTGVAGAAVQLVGGGVNATVLKWRKDLGRGQYAVRWPDSAIANHSLYHAIRDLTIEGPGLNVGPGQPPCQMSGVRASDRARISNVNVQSFYAGLEKIGSHQVYEKLTIGGCYYAVYMTAGTGGNVSWYDCVLDGRMAAIGIAGDYMAVDETFIHCHLNSSPYGIYGEAGSTSLLVGCQFINTGWEGIGNAAIGVAAGGGFAGMSQRLISDCWFHHVGLLWSDQLILPGVPRHAAIEIGDVVQFSRFSGVGSFAAVGTGQVAWIKARALQQCTVADAVALVSNLRTAAIPVLKYYDGILDSDSTIEAGQTRYAAVRINAVHARDTPAAIGQNGTALPFGTGTARAPFGIISTAGAMGDCALVAVAGPAQAMVGGAAIAEGDVLTVAASSPTGVGPGSTDSHPIFGVATDSAAANAAVPIWVRPQF